MKITADTNVLISGTFWEGDSFRILEKAKQKEVTLVLSEEILSEYEEVLAYQEIKDKIQDKNLEIMTTLKELRAMSTLVIPLEKFDAIKEDPDDNAVLECAFAGRVDFIISQDNHLLNLKEFRGIKILSPGDFLRMFY